MKKIKRFIKSFKYATEGIIVTLKSEQNIKVHVFIMMLVIIFGIILKINKIEWIICIILFGIVISSEFFNTAIETIVDMVCPEKNDKAKIAKDTAAGAVLINAIAAFIIGGIIFFPKILQIVQM